VAYTEERQAAEPPVRLEAAFRAGLDRVFYSHLVERPHVEETFFREGLITLDGFRRKPVFEAYRPMIADNAHRCPETSSG
tara:strand:- start:1082 stop:1321 length:240 start_codon:yes stop_codon:yes gene_type:complete